MTEPVDWLLIRGGKEFRNGSGIGEVQEREIFSTLCKFINDNALGLKKFPIDAEHDWEGFEIRYSNLTAQGQAVMRAAFTRWLTAIDRGTVPSKIKILQRTLEKLCST